MPPRLAQALRRRLADVERQAAPLLLPRDQLVSLWAWATLDELRALRPVVLAAADLEDGHPAALLAEAETLALLLRAAARRERGGSPPKP